MWEFFEKVKRRFFQVFFMCVFFYRVLFPDIQYETFLYLCVHLNVSLAKKKKEKKMYRVFGHDGFVQ